MRSQEGLTVNYLAAQRLGLAAQVLAIHALALGALGRLGGSTRLLHHSGREDQRLETLQGIQPVLLLQAILLALMMMMPSLVMR